MDMTDTRRTHLRKLIDERFDGVIARFAEAIDRAPNYVSRVLNGKKGIGEDFCRDVESRLGLPARWLDGLPEIGETLIDADVLYRCTEAVDAYLAAGRRRLDPKQRLHLACLLYSMFHDRPEASIDEMVTFMERWRVIAAKGAPPIPQ